MATSRKTADRAADDTGVELEDTMRRAPDAIVIDDTPLDIEVDVVEVWIGRHRFVVVQPDGQLIMEIENAGSTERLLALVFDEQWPEVRPLVAPLDRKKLMDLVRQLGDRLGFSEQAMREQAGPNRAARRRRSLPR